MARFLTQRIVWAVITLLLLVTIVFFAVNLLLPYDAAVNIGGRPRAIEELRGQLGLDRPLWLQWLDYMGGLLRLDLGDSFEGFSVTNSVKAALPTTVAIFAVGGIIAYLLGEWMGRVVAWHRNRLFKASATTASVLLFTAFPPWLVFLLVYFLTPRLYQVRSWFGLQAVDYRPLPDGSAPAMLALGMLAGLVGGILLRGWARRHDRRLLAAVAVPLGFAAFVVALIALGAWSDAIHIILLPSGVMATLGIVLIAFGETMLVMRAGVAAERAEDYVFTARAKGVPEHFVRDRHAAPNALLPAMSRFLTSLPYLLTGLIIIERELRLRGLASLLFESIESGDVPVILGVLVMIGMIGLVLRIVLDLIQAIVDPRIRVTGSTA